MKPKYTVLLRPAARRDLKHLARKAADRVLAALSQLEQSPRPQGAKKLTGREQEWRLRVSNYRVLYEIDAKAKVVHVFRIRHRREVYR